MAPTLPNIGKLRKECARPESFGAMPQRIGPAAYRLSSANVNAIKVQRLRRLCKTGTLRWVTVEDDDVQEGRA